jgi:flagellar protein FlaF
MQNKNPHAAAAGKYDKNAQSHTPDQRELEARVLLKSAKNMQMLKDDWDNSMTPEMLDDVLRYNRHIWLMFVDTAVEDADPGRPQELRNNIANLGMFIFNHSVEILANPVKEKLDVLIEINREIAAGLMTRPKVEEPAEAKAE